MSKTFDITTVPITCVVSPEPITERERSQFRWAVEQGWRAVLQNIGDDANSITPSVESQEGDHA